MGKWVTCLAYQPSKKNSKIIEKIFGGFGKKSYLCIIDAKRTKASENYGMAMEKIFPSARGSSAWRSGKNEERRNRF